MAKPNQTTEILKHLLTIGPITSNQAFELYGCTRLSAKIYDIKRQGFTIKTTRLKGRNRYNNAVNFASYELVRDGNDNT